MAHVPRSLHLEIGDPVSYIAEQAARLAPFSEIDWIAVNRVLTERAGRPERVDLRR